MVGNDFGDVLDLVAGFLTGVLLGLVFGDAIVLGFDLGLRGAVFLSNEGFDGGDLFVLLF